METIPTLYITRDDLRKTSKFKRLDEIEFVDIKDSIEPIRKAEMCILVDIDTKTSRVIKNRYNIGKLHETI